jgi:NAD-dependent deacetylase
MTSIVEVLKAAKRPFVLTGAGISRESGIPTYRGTEGLWRDHRPEELATPSAFRRDPKLVWEWYDWRRQFMSKCRPNPGHLALRDLETRFEEMVIVTQNVDGLHQQAGSRTVVELHGNIWRIRCTECPHSVESREAPLPELPPRCPECGALLRPGVVWFGEPLPAPAIERASELAGRADAILVVGTSANVHPAASLPYLTRANGGTVIEINPDPTPLSDVADHSLRGTAGEMLPELVRRVLGP